MDSKQLYKLIVWISSSLDKKSNGIRKRCRESAAKDECSINRKQ